MSETNPTPAEAIPFALVNEDGHLTGKPAEGVTAMIQAATEDLKAKLTEATAKAGIDEAAVEKIITDHENDVLKAWQDDPAYAKMISSIKSRQIWKEKRQNQRPGDFWLYLLSVLNAVSIPPADFASFFTMEAATGNLDNYDSFSEWWEHLQTHEGSPEDLPEMIVNWPEGINRIWEESQGAAAFGMMFWFYALRAAFKTAAIGKMELEGDYLKIQPGPRVIKPVYIPVLREKPGA